MTATTSGGTQYLCCPLVAIRLKLKSQGGCRDTYFSNCGFFVTKNKLVHLLLLLLLHSTISCPTERGQGAAVQLALPDGRSTEHGLGLRIARGGRLIGGDGGVPNQQQQGVTTRREGFTLTARSTKTFRTCWKKNNNWLTDEGGIPVSVCFYAITEVNRS